MEFKYTCENKRDGIISHPTGEEEKRNEENLINREVETEESHTERTAQNA